MIEKIFRGHSRCCNAPNYGPSISVSEKDRMYYAYPTEFLQQLNASRLPPALLCLKVSYPVILLRNLDPGEELCNRTRIVVLNVRRKMLQCRITSKNKRFRGKVVLILRINRWNAQVCLRNLRSAGLRLRPGRND